jgi:nucleoside-diphosphate-sugar epimerase
MSRQAARLDPIVILGASGFVGNRALERARRLGHRVRVLVHRRPVSAPGVEVVQGDAGDPDALLGLLVRDAVVINFVHGGERLAEALAEACVRLGVRRIVHVSTCSVYGRSPGRRLDEDSPCLPVSEYERTKLAVEHVLEARAGRYQLVILRPTAVFGPGGRNLETLALRVLRQSWPLRYLRACAMGRRRMHAVDVEYVAAATLFLAAAALEHPGERFIVSQDDEPENNYAALEELFVRRLHAARYPVPPLRLPEAALRAALRILGRSDVEPARRYSAAKLAQRGFVPPRDFAAGLGEYADWIARHARS